MSAQFEAYRATLYARCTDEDGELVVIDRTKKKAVGIFRFDDPALVQAVRRREVFIKPNPIDGDRLRERLHEARGYAVGRIDEVKTLVGFFLDVDAGKRPEYPTRQQAVEACLAMPKAPTLFVDSDGDTGGFHVYWLLEKPHRIIDEADREKWQAMSRRWQERLREIVKELSGKTIDATANIDRMLRPCGSVRASGNEVRCYWFERRYYRPDDLFIAPSKREIVDDVRRNVRAELNQLLGPIKNTGRPVSDYIEAAGLTPQALLIDAGYMPLRDPLEWQRPGASNPGRSLKIATSHERQGVNIFSAADPHFDCMKRDGSPGRFYSVDEMFVSLRFQGDWQSAARWCRQQMTKEVAA